MVSVVVLVILAPVEHKNKRLDALEKTIYRWRMLRNLAIAVMGATALMLLSLDSFSIASLCGIMLSAVTAGLGKAKWTGKVFR